MEYGRSSSPIRLLLAALEGGEDVVGVILDNIVVDGVSLGATLGTRFDIDSWMVLSRAVLSQPHLNKSATAPAARKNNSAGMPHVTAPVPTNRVLKAVVAPKKLTSDRERRRSEYAKLFCRASLCDQ